MLTLHDAIDQVFYAPRTPWRKWLTKAGIISRTYLLIARTVAEHVVTVSEHARGDLIRKLRLRPDRVTVVPEAADPAFLVPVTEAAKDAVRARVGPDPAVRFLRGRVGGTEEYPVPVAWVRRRRADRGRAGSGRRPGRGTGRVG